MDKTEIINKLLNGELKLYQIENLTDSIDEAIDIRREFIEKYTNTNLENMSNYTLDMDNVFKKNIENPIGAVQIPVGVAGPLLINGNEANGEFYVPLATSEGALVASINRGCSAIRASGGVNAHIIHDQMTRAPAIKTKSSTEALKVKAWF